VAYRVPTSLAALVLVSTAIVSSCSSSLPSSVGSAPVLSVATGLWPLAQMASLVGGDKAAVVDVVPTGEDPFSYVPDARGTNTLRSAALVLEVGDGFQPGVEKAAAGARSVSQLGPAVGTADPYLWLDPPTMQKALTAIVAAMSAADPGASPLFRRNAGGLAAELQSLGIDYSSTFSACPGTVIVTPDTAFSAMAGDYGLRDIVVGPHPPPTAIPGLVSSLPSNSKAAGIEEPWVDGSGVAEAAAAGHFNVRPAATLIADPAAPAPADTYFAQMEQLLGTLSRALGCGTAEQ
jgi:zinc transport system substrate-binding protein